MINLQKDVDKVSLFNYNVRKTDKEVRLMNLLKDFAVTVLSLTDDEKKVVYGFIVGMRAQDAIKKKA